MHYQGLDLNLLVVLDALLAEKNITRTGERIHLSQSATSGALARLRDYFNDGLLVQVGNKMIPTPLAEDLAGPVRELLQRAEFLINRVPTFDPTESTRNFRLMMSDYAASVLMPRVLSRIQQVAPKITFELLSNAEHPTEVLERGDVDLLIIPPEYTSRLHPSEELFQDRYVCLVWNENPLIGERLSLQQYKEMGHVGVRLGKQQMHMFDELFLEREKFQRRIEVVCMTFGLLPRLVVGTNRIATVPERLARNYASEFQLKILPTPVTIPPLCEVAQWHTYQEKDTALSWMRSVLMEVAAAM